MKCVLRLFACGFCGFARVMWSGISFLLDTWFLRLLGEGQFRILPLRGRPKKQGSYAKSSSSQSGRISSIASIAFNIATLHCLVSFTASRIPIKSHPKAVNSSKSRVIVRVLVVLGVKLNAIPGGRSIFVLKPRAICSSSSHIRSSRHLSFCNTSSLSA